MRAFDGNQYLRIPYLAGGRDRNGLDCWGLARLVYAEQFDIDLPGHDEATIEQCDGAGLADYLATHKEGWVRVESPLHGDLVLIRSKGEPYHVGVVIEGGWFIHARSGRSVVAERYGSRLWRPRIEGFYRYQPAAGSVSVSCRPHPLKLARIDATAAAGQSLAAVISAQCAGVRSELIKRGIAFLNGRRVPSDQWAETLLSDGDALEFRMLPGDDDRSVLMIMVAVVAAAAGGAASSSWTAADAAATGISANTMGGFASLATTVVGSLIVNRIAPLPEANEDTANQQWTLSGGTNQATPYGAFPVVLGTHRMTPPLGARSYLTTNGHDRFLHLLLVWGYGPLDITDLKIGDTLLSSFEDVDVITLRGDAYEYAAGVLDRTRPEVAAFLDLYGQATNQQQPQVRLTTTNDTRTTEQVNVRRADVVLSFPGGLVKYIDGWAWPSTVEVLIEYRRLGYWDDSGAWVSSVGSWQTGSTYIGGISGFTLETYRDVTTLTVRNRTIVGLRNGRELFIKQSVMDPQNPYAIAWPVMAFNEVPLYRIEGHTLIDTMNTDRFSGLSLTITSEVVVTRDWDVTTTETTWRLAVGAGSVGESFYFSGSDNDPFDRVVPLDFSAAPGQYEIRMRRTTEEDTGALTANACHWLMLTEFAENPNPVAPPAPMAMTAVRIRATNQINGTLDGISGTVQSRQLIWDGAAWRLPDPDESRSNPATLIRHVLQHPGYAKRVASDRIDLAQLQHFAEFCDGKGFIYENVLTGQRPMRDVLREIAAAGRASITQADGLWSVVIDEPKTQIAQHFTPHNSWGFKGTLLLPEVPHALKVQFLNRRKDYQPDEFRVYSDGYTGANATLIESISLPGVTDTGTEAEPGPVFKLGRFHLEQLTLRREEYELYADHEAIVCTRGDRVEVAHDVPMWGLGSGRIKAVTLDGSLRATAVELDEAVAMAAGRLYALRWRTASNGESWASVNTVAGQVMALEFSAPVAGTVPEAGDLFMFGEAERMTQSLLVKSVEPMPNMQARLTFDDYAPAVFDAETAPFGTWQSGITLPPPLLRAVINQVPVVEAVIADEFALTRSSGGYQANIVLRWRTDAARATAASPTTEALAEAVAFVEVQYRRSDSIGLPWKSSDKVDVHAGVATIGPLTESVTYDVRLRFVGETGRSGDWLLQSGILVTGKTNAPVTVTGLRASFADTALTAATVTLDWDDSPEMDVVDYLVSRPGRSVYVQASTFTELAEWVGDRVYTVQARDVVGNLSAAATLTITKAVPAAPQNFRASVVDNNVLFYWDAPAVTTLPIDSFELRRGDTEGGAEVIGRKAGGFTTVFETDGGAKTYWLYTIDTDGQSSSAASLTVTVDAPPDYSLKLDHDSALDGTLTNAVVERGVVILPINTTESIGTHYSSQGWTTRQDQINAGYPIYAQPVPASGYYEEIIDYGATLASSRVTVSPTIETVAGAPALTVTISSRLSTGDAWADHTGAQAYITNFRYIKVRVTVASSGDDIVRLLGLNVRLDSKLKTITGMVSAVSTDSGGTTVYLTEDRTSTGPLVFVDVDSIQLTPQGTTPLTAVFDFTDAPNPPSMKVLLFNAAGARASGTVSYTVRGY